MSSICQSVSSFSHLACIMPQNQQQIQQKHKRLIKKIRQRYTYKQTTNHQHKQVYPCRQSSKSLTNTQKTRVKSSKQLRIHVNCTNPSSSNIQRPFSEVKTRTKQKQQQSPLKVIQNRKKFNQNNRPSITMQSQKYLRKGTAVNKAILLNILRSKLTSKIQVSTDSYGSHQNYESLLKQIKQQIPTGLRDVVGAEQMLRMSNIFTGSGLFAISLQKKMRRYIEKGINKDNNLQQQMQDQGLRSIKRW